MRELAALRERDLPTHGGRLFAYVYDPALDGLDDLAAAAHALSAHVNGLDPTAFPSLLAMENDLVAAAAHTLGGDRSTVGSITSGGTESLILAVKAARDARPDLAASRLVMPVAAHAALAKAASYLRVALDTVPVDPVTLRVDPAAVAAAITADTVLVACSAPSYAHGLIDPVTVMRHIGDDGYLTLAAQTRDAVRGLSTAVSEIKDLSLVPVESTVVAFMSSTVDLFVLADELAARGWHTQPQFRHGAIPPSVHLTVTAAVAEFAKDLAAAVEAARALGPVELPPGILDLLGSASAADLAGALGLGEGGALPERMATVNTLLNAAPPAVREHLLVSFLSLLQRPSW